MASTDDATRAYKALKDGAPIMKVCCMIRGHEEPRCEITPENAQSYGMQAASEWKTCKWCGTQYKEVKRVVQVERELSAPEVLARAITGKEKE